jgi:hypothetical protein
MPISYKAETGEAWSLSPDGEWVPTQVAKNPQTGETFALDGAEWKPIPAAAPERSALGTVNNFVGGVSDAITQGATLGFADEAGAGVRALVRGGTNLLQGKDADLSGNYDRALADIRGREKQFAEQHPVASGVGNVLGGVAAGLPRAPVMAPSRGRMATIGRSAATGAGLGAVGGFGSAEGGFQNRLNSAVEGATLGAAIGGAIPAAAGVASRVVTPFRNQLTPEAQRLTQVARAEGIPLSAAQATGSRPLHSLEAFFETHPMTASTQQAESQAQRRAFNWAALRRIEESGDDLSPATLSRARDRIGGDLESLAAQTRLKPDAQFTRDLADARAEYSRRLDAMKKPVFDTFADDIEKMMGTGGIPGATYQSTRSTLSKMAQSAGGSDPYFAQALRKLRDTLDDAADRSMPANLKDAWREARRQYGNLRTLEKAMSNTTTQAASGNLSPTQLALAVKQQHPRGYGFGYGEMNDLSKVGNQFVRSQIPNSGTPERLFWQNLLTNPLSYGATAIGTAIDPWLTAGTIGTTLFGPRLAQMAYNTRPVQGYLRNQVMANAGPGLRHGLLTGFAGAAGGGLLGQ